MDKKKINREKAVELILADLKKGLHETVIRQNIVRICPDVSSKTIQRYFKEAREQFKEFTDKVNPIIEAQEIEILGSSARSGILTKLERQKILSDIGAGRVSYFKDVPTKFGIITIEARPSWSDRKAAIQELNKMDNAYADDINPDEELTEIVIKRINPNDVRT